jgi:hypothetical protein
MTENDHLDLQVIRQDARQQGRVVATPFCWRDPATIPPRRWLYGRHTIRKFASATVAPGGVGKTSEALTEQLAIVTGRDLLGDQVHESGPCWYVGLEDPLEEYERRVAAICLHYDIAAGDIEDRFYLDSGRDQSFVIARQDRNGITIAEPVRDSIIDEVRLRQIVQLTVDPFVHSHDVGENDNGAIAAVVKQWAHVADVTGTAVELVHHPRKLAPGIEISVDDVRGGGSFVAGTRSVRLLAWMTEQEYEQAGVLDERHRYFRIINGKGNLHLAPEHATWRRLESVPLGNGDCIGVVTSWQWPDAFEDVTTDHLRRVQAALSTGHHREDPQAKAWAGHAVARVLGLDTTRKHHRAKIKTLLDTWIKNDVLRRAELIDPEQRKSKPCIVVGEAVQ